MSQTIVLIHGAWLTPASWEPFKERYEARGYRVLAPAWPYHDRPLEELRRDPDPQMSRLTIERIVDHYDRILRAMPDRPIVMGHSFGGLIVQLLLDRELASAGVAINPVAPKGVPPDLATLRRSLPVLTTWKGWHRPVTLSFPRFASAFAPRVTPAEQRDLYERHVVPTPGRILYQAVLGHQTRLDPNKEDRVPLLLVASGEDRALSSSMVEANFRRQRRAAATTEFLKLPGRSHFALAEKGWEELADYALDWAAARTPSATNLAPLASIAPAGPAGGAR